MFERRRRADDRLAATSVLLGVTWSRALLYGALTLAIPGCFDPTAAGALVGSTEGTEGTGGTDAGVGETGITEASTSSSGVTSAGVGDTTTSAADESTDTVDTSEGSSETAEVGDASTSDDGSSSDSGEPAALPDLDMEVAFEDAGFAAYFERVTFAENSCEVLDACVVGSGSRVLMRFWTYVPNVGAVDFHAGTAASDPALFESSECAGTELVADQIRYRLFDLGGTLLAENTTAIALQDDMMWLPGAGSASYPGGGEMGISPGWSAYRTPALPCQLLDITGIPDGDYMFEVTVNPMHTIEESNYDNNAFSVLVTVTAPAEVPAEWTCSVVYYASDDGCDCGCGAVDPDCVDATAAACEFCNDPGGCSSTCADIDPVDNAHCV